MLVHDLLVGSAECFPDKTAVVAGGHRLTYAELDAGASRVAHALLESGVRYGDRVAILLENSVESALSIFGILKAGAAFVVVNPTTKPDKLVFMLNDCSARAFIAGARFTEAVRAVDSEVASVRCIMSCGTGPPAPATSRALLDFDSAITGHPDRSPKRRAIDIDLAAIIYTSGSTGVPKGVAVSHLNVVSTARSITTYLENVPEDVIINMLPLSFDYGLYQLLMSVKMGATLVIERSFAYPFRLVQRVSEERVTGFAGVPTVFAMLLQMKDLDPACFDSVRYVTNTAAALPPAHQSRLRKLFRNAKLYSMYGVTECKRVSYMPPEELEKKPTSVGKGMPNCQAYVVDKEGNPVGPGVVGELVVRGANVMMGYWNRPEETGKVLRPGRYPGEKLLHTGDLFRTDEEGYLYFVARKDDIIKSRGEKVSPREVENVIYELEEVGEAAVIGVPDPILGQAVKAFVVSANGAVISERDVVKHCARRLENFMVPKFVEFCDSLPKTASGKIRRRALPAAAGRTATATEGRAT
jgi:amino acid adenylation domain-containing protein